MKPALALSAGFCIVGIGQKEVAMSDADLIAKFLATKGATVVAEGVAYGVSAEADKAKRAANREARRYEATERNAERRAEQVREAYHTGGRRAALEVLQGERYQDYTHDE